MGVSEQPGSIDHHTVSLKQEKKSVFSPVMEAMKIKLDRIFKLSERKILKIKNDYLSDLSTHGMSFIDEESKEQLKSIFVSGDDIVDYINNEIYETDIRSMIHEYFACKAEIILSKLEQEIDDNSINKTIKTCDTLDDYNNIDLSRNITDEGEKLLYDVLSCTAAGYKFNDRITKALNKLGYSLEDFRVKHYSKNKFNNQILNAIQQEIDMLNKK